MGTTGLRRGALVALFSVVALSACAPTEPGGPSTSVPTSSTSTTSTSTTSTSTTSTTTTSTTTSTTTTTEPPAPTVEPARLGSGDSHTCALTSAGAVKCWGRNSQGQLGVASITESLTPIVVPGLSAARSVVAGNAHSCAITAVGGVECWGSNTVGQLGDGTNSNRSEPTPVVGLSSGVAVLAAGDNHTCAGLTSGGIRCWGWGAYGQLGNDSIASSTSPVPVAGITQVAVAMSGGSGHSCAALGNGALKCWGRSNAGQLGNDSLVNSRVPVDVVGMAADVIEVANGGAHTCAVRTSTASCWGLNSVGQLGIGVSGGTAANRRVPVEVTGATGIRAVAAGASHSCALSAGGAVTCWGDNGSGVLGTGSSSPDISTTPLQVSGLTSGVDELRAGALHTCVLSETDTIRCWGDNTYGQLGTGTTSNSNKPVVVSGF